MASGLVVHIQSGDQRHTEVITSDRILIGSGPDCQLQLVQEPFTSLTDRPVVALELARSNGRYHVARFDPALSATLNGTPLAVDAKIDDGDKLIFEDCRISLQFFPVGGLPVALARQPHETHVAPFIETAAIESAATARRDDAKVFLREFTRELVREINTSTKIITIAIAAALVGGMLYIGFGLYRELITTRRVIDQQQEALKTMSEQVTLAGNQINQIDQTNNQIRDSLSLAPKIRADYGAGVSLLAGSFYFVEAGTGRPLRYLETQTGEDGTVIQNGNDPSQLTPEGNGPVAEFEFVGTGFYVGDGYVLTNRHVSQPWIADERAQSLASAVNAQPRLKRLVAYFPGHPQAMPLKFLAASQRDDIAVTRLENKDAATGIPVLPLDPGSEAIAVGKSVVMMGYPSGPDRLLALLDDAEARNIQARYGSSLEGLLNFLASRNKVQPLTTQGDITDLDARRIVYDAKTAAGGSGAPLFGQSGRVIGINFAVFTENTASNFAVPARFAINLLQRTGWKPPVPLTQETSSQQTQTPPQGQQRGPATPSPAR